MKKFSSISDVESTVGACKEKAVNIQIKLNSIQRNAVYKDIGAFEFYKKNIELVLGSVEDCLVACEGLISIVNKNMSEGWITNPDEPFSDVSEDFAKIIKVCSSDFKEIDNLIELAQNEEFEY